MKNCKCCATDFDITDKDLEFYEKVSPIFGGKKFLVPTPEFCPDCREQKRLSFINENKFYNHKCACCSEKMVSRFHSESGYTVYCNHCWSSDTWDARDYGIDFDFNKTFFEQIQELTQKVPFQNLIGSLSNIKHNAIYTNHTADIHNSYMVTESDGVSGCMYSRGLRKSTDLVDCLNCSHSENCYECIDSDRLYNCYYNQRSTSCSDSYFLYNCHGCNSCIGCVNLSNKQYYIFNKPATKKEYLNLKEKLESSECKNEIFEKYRRVYLNEPHLFEFIINSEESSGNDIINSKGCKKSYDIIDSQDIKYCTDINYSNDLMDVSAYGSKSFLMYDSVSVGRYSHNILFSSIVGKGENLLYCIDTKKSKNCFGCVDLKGGNYCILNKQYTKEQYDILVPKIIQKMISDGEWGSFFSPKLSPFGYNESLANDYFPLDDYQALEQGYNWSYYKSPFPQVTKTISAEKLPSNIKDIPDDILNWALLCEDTKKPFIIMKSELDFYRKHNLPIPKKHPDRRYLDRIQLRNPRKLFTRNCDKCGIEIQTTFSENKSEKIYCKECYNKYVIN